MSTVNFYDEAKKLEETTEHFIRKRLVDGDGFEIDIYIYKTSGAGKLHDCGKDEFFFVLKGEAEITIDNKISRLKAGEGILAKAGIKHKHSAPNQLWMLCISKWPHKHVYYE